MTPTRCLAAALVCGLSWPALAVSDAPAAAGSPKYAVAARLDPALEGAGGRYRVHGAQLRGETPHGLRDARGRRLDGRLAPKEVLACGPTGDLVFSNSFEN